MNKDLILLMEIAIREHGIKGTYEHLSEAIRNTAEKSIPLESEQDAPRYHLPVIKDAFRRIAEDLDLTGLRMEKIFLGEI